MPRKGRQRFLAGFEPVQLVFGEVLAETGERIRHVYFPAETYVSLVMPIDGCAGMAVGLVGDEGTLGISFILGVDTSSLKALVRISGAALSMEAAQFRRELEQSLALCRRQVAKVPLLRSPESPLGGGDQRVWHVERHGSDDPILGLESLRFRMNCRYFTKSRHGDPLFICRLVFWALCHI